MQEATTRLIDLKEDDPDVIERVLDFMYTMDYEDKKTLTQKELRTLPQIRFSCPDESPVGPQGSTEGVDGVTKKVSQIGETFNETLQTDDTLELEQVLVHMNLMINVQVYAAADRYGIHLLKDKSKEKFDGLVFSLPRWDFPGILHEILTTTPCNDRGLRDTALKICAEQNIVECLSTSETPNSLTFALKEDPDFMMEVLRTARAKNIDAKIAPFGFGPALRIFTQG